MVTADLAPGTESHVTSGSRDYIPPRYLHSGGPHSTHSTTKVRPSRPVLILIKPLPRRVTTDFSSGTRHQSRERRLGKSFRRAEENKPTLIQATLLSANLHSPLDCFHQSRISHPKYSTDMASRASRGRKQAKKGVQLTLMVVGESLLPIPTTRLRDAQATLAGQLSSEGFWSRHSSSSAPMEMLIRTRADTPRSGASGTGRTTFVNTLVESPLLDHRLSSLLSDPSNPHSPFDSAAIRKAAEDAHVENPIRIKPINVELEEDGVRIALTVVDTPGFGDGVDNEYW